MWSPAASTGTELLATTGDYLRLWNTNSDEQFELKALLNNNRHTGAGVIVINDDYNQLHCIS